MLHRLSPEARFASGHLINDALRASGVAKGRLGAAPAAALVQFDLNGDCEGVGEEEAEAQKLPGPKAKQAQALFENVRWLASDPGGPLGGFGEARLGFLTLTLGDHMQGPLLPGQKRPWIGIRNRAEANRRYNSLCTHLLKKMYQCGVVVMERHQSGHIHFHLIVLCAEDIRTGCNLDECFPAKDSGRIPNYRSANQALKDQWRFWRERAEAYGFGRCQMQPVKKTGEAVARYLAKYISKMWATRIDEDKGARLIRYFGHWDKTPKLPKARPTPPPHGCRFMRLTEKTWLWRQSFRQVTAATDGQVNEHNMKKIGGHRWAWRAAKVLPCLRLVVGDRHQGQAVAVGNGQVAEAAALVRGHNATLPEGDAEAPGVVNVWEKAASVEFWEGKPRPWDSDFFMMKIRRENLAARNREKAFAESLKTPF